MNNWNPPIHCHTQTGWDRSKDLVARVDLQLPEKSARIKEIALQIKSAVIKLSPIVQPTCQATCVTCEDICCRRATIWYDIKDLLYLYYSGNSVPKKQIQKLENNGTPACPNFTKNGCILPRQKRPFVCTWYFCTAQKDYMKKNNPEQRLLIEEHLLNIKRLRNRILTEFSGIV